MSEAQVQDLARDHDAAGAVDALARRVAELGRRVPLVARATPRNWEAEIRRLTAVRRAVGRGEPAFRYQTIDDAEPIADELEAIASAVEGVVGPGHALPGRARELALEARIAAAVGTPSLVDLAKARFRSRAEDDVRAARWAAYPHSDSGDDAPLLVSDDDTEPGSLLSAMKRAVGALRLPVRVIVRPDLSALAATGEGVVVIASGRLLRPRDVARTVVHEIEGHVIPWLRRAREARPIRPAGDSDAEEGRALAVERAHGFLDDRRRKELGMRHMAACLAHDRAGFHDIVDRLEAWDAPTSQAVRIAARALRGGGLGRERVYLPALWRLERR